MSFVPGYRYDLFFSYSREDDDSGWVTTFRKVLVVAVRQRLGRAFTDECVFYDRESLKLGQNFEAELAKAAEGSAILIPVLSQLWVDSG
jgi:hypothetical protein